MVMESSQRPMEMSSMDNTRIIRDMGVDTRRTKMGLVTKASTWMITDRAMAPLSTRTKISIKAISSKT